ncbi:MAG: preprotein translocase subunit YajC [Deltaproteobacteria bacterium]|jgi:preprotein translocase subunit YajC|nr:preprotein translocase subunit YajC [Deltaproteobacteria bacterium]
MLTYLLFTASQAWAMAPSQGAEGQPQGGGMQLFIIMGGFILIFYFLLLRPQRKQQRERQAMIDGIKKGDRIQTTGGLLGTVTAVDQKEITLRIAPEVRVKLARAGVAGVVKGGEPEQLEKTSLDKKTD